jgi:RNA polymerase sigma factor (sigma-70 family)
MTDWQLISQKIYRYFAARHSHQDALELVQETLRRVVAKQADGRIDLARGTVLQYSYGVALNIGREFRKRRVHASLAENEIGEIYIDATIPDPEQRLILARRSIDLRNAITKLSATEAEIIALLIDHDLSMNEIASLLELPIGTIKSHISRAKQRLKEILNPGVVYE